MNPGTFQCRLCAEIKQSNLFTNFQNDDENRRKVLARLSYFRIVTSLDSINDQWAKTVCFLCVYLLDKAHGFLTRIIGAQSYFPVPQITAKETGLAIDNTDAQAIFDILRVDDSAGHSQVKEIQNPASSSNSKPELSKYPEVDEAPEPSTANDNKPHRSQQKTICPSRSDKEVLKEKDRADAVQKTPLTSWKDYSWLCAFCDAVFSHFNEIRKHSMHFHSSCNVFRCIDCKSRKYELDKFIRHVVTHQQDLSLSCYKCHKILPSVNCLQRHRRFHQKSEYKCSGCNETFGDLGELCRHRQAYSKRFKNPLPMSLQKIAEHLTCLKCDKTYDNRSTLRAHLLTHTERPRDYICDTCGKGFLNKAKIAEHLPVHDNVKRYYCKTCRRWYRTISKYQEHLKSHDDIKPFSCKICDRRFRLKKYLMAHASVHTNQRPFVCEVCNKGFRFNNKLIEHKRQHTGEKPFSCDICIKSFTNYPNYHKHLKKHMGKIFG